MESNLISRRTALAMGGSLALAAGTGLKSLAAESGRLIDVHHHYFAPAWMTKFKKEIEESNGARFFTWTVQTALDELNRRKLVVYVHPKLTSDLNDEKDPLRALGINWENTTRTISSMLSSGILMRLPDVKFIFSHGAGLLPMVAARFAGRSPEKLAALKRLYMDTAQTTTNAGAWGAITAFAEPSHILFGSDFPYVVDGLSLGLKSVKL